MPDIASVMPDLIGHLPTARGRKWGRRADEVVGAPDAVPPLAPTIVICNMLVPVFSQS